MPSTVIGTPSSPAGEEAEGQRLGSYSSEVHVPVTPMLQAFLNGVSLEHSDPQKSLEQTQHSGGIMWRLSRATSLSSPLPGGN